MAIPRIARIHLVYQFIILTLLVFAIGYNEILPDKKYLFLALIPVFCYQLMIVFCCTELLPLPSWINVQEHVRGSSIDEDIPIETKGPSVGNLELVQKLPKSSETSFPKKLSTFKYSLKNRKTEVPSNKASEAQEIHACGTEFLNNGTVSGANSRQGEFEATKTYYFPYRQKRLEEWIEQNETVRPYKVRNSKPGNECNNSNSAFNQKSPIHIRHVEEKKSPIPKESEDEIQIDDDEPIDLKKSYSYPFRYRKIERYLECDENLENDLTIPTMPPWKALNYCKSVTPGEGRRKSLSTEALHEELKVIKSSCQPEKNDFSQSMELTATSSLDAFAVKKIPLKPTTSFNKFKQGIVNCFNKSKSIKTDETKQNNESRKQFFRELFLSKESLNFESVEKEASEKKVKPEKSSKLGELFQPSYVSYASDSFTDDVKIYSHPRNFKK